MQMQGYLDTKTVSLLTGDADRRIREKAERGEYEAERFKCGRGGENGERYLIAVSSLPIEAQIIYHEMNRDLESDDYDLAGYLDQYGQEGLRELLQRQRAAQQGLALRVINGADLKVELQAVAQEHKITVRTLYRWMNDYAEQGIKGLMRVKRKDKGTARSICPAAYQIAYGMYTEPVKRTHSTIYRKLETKAAEMGKNACAKCAFNPGTAARMQLEFEGLADQYPPCADPDKSGMRIPNCRQTLSRILAQIPADEQTLSRRGAKAWKDAHMVMATREKPDKVNEVWFGDHHQFDCFVLDEDGKPVRPWLTAWYDAASGCLVGWVLCTNPNTETITEAFARAAAHTQSSPFYGLPSTVYIDNGKDYRSKTFEGGRQGEYDLGYLNSNIATSSVVQLLNVTVRHAIAYQAWSKTIERFFGTLEGIWIREVPGWCGGSPDKRPEEFDRTLRQLWDRGQLWTMDQFYDYLVNTVFPDYHSRPHEGHGGQAPIDVYNSLPRARYDQPSWSVLSIARMDTTSRRLSQSGIKFKNRLYWDDAMIGLAGSDVTLRYSRSDLSSVTVILDGKFLCEAPLKETLKVVGEDPEVLAAHVGKQRKQLQDTKARIKHSSRNMFMEAIDERRAGGNITSLEYDRAARGRKTKRTEIAAKAGEQVPEENAARSMMLRLGTELLQRAAENANGA